MGADAGDECLRSALNARLLRVNMVTGSGRRVAGGGPARATAHSRTIGV